MLDQLFKFLQALWQVALSDSAGFLLSEVAAIASFARDVISTEFDYSLTPDQKAELRKDAASTLRMLLVAAEVQGGKLAADLPGILLKAGGADLIGLFGFSTASATIATNPLPQ